MITRRWRSLNASHRQRSSSPAFLHRGHSPAPKPQYHLRHLQRFPLRTSSPSIVAYVKALVSRPELDEATLAVDHTGVAVFDMLEGADLPCPLYGVTIHGGDTVTYEGGRYRVPKRDLITLTQVLLQNARRIDLLIQPAAVFQHAHFACFLRSALLL